MKDYRFYIRLIEVFLILVFGFVILGADGCTCNKPFIEKIEVWKDSDPNTEGYEEQVLPLGLTYTIPINTSFRIKIKTQETLSNDELSRCMVIIQTSPETTLPIEYLSEENLYKADYSAQTGSLTFGTYNTIIYIYHNGQYITQSIYLKIE